jgi:hypothetical protein|tara:strand:+ start:684 stop:1211 length:528 start_codon:yes stop_codon:yes gene_type:complete
MFEAPIPGQSLTNEPKNYAWENPPKFIYPEDALIWHMERLEEPERIKSIFHFLKLDVDVVTLVEGITRNAVAEGFHTIDVSLIISPVIHEYIVGIAEVAGVEFNEGLDEEEADGEELAYDIREKEARKILSELKRNKEPDLDVLEESLPEKPSVVQEEMPEEKPQGLMARPQGVN